ncbi:hypothetical protein OAS67_02875 [Alphaproteobacteria bacterium]|nr:hypothetical protein [Alphaproteobacteria bacterium]
MNKLMRILGMASAKTLFVCAFVSTFFALLEISSLKSQIDADRGTVLVDMSVSSGGVSNMWVNDQTQRPMNVKLIPDVRTVYEFSGVAEDIRYLRLDPLPGIRGATIRIYNVEIQSPAGGKQRLGPSDLAKWQVFNGSRVALTDNYIEYVSAQNIILTTDANYHVALFYPAFIHNFANVVFDISRFNIILGLYFLCLVLASIWARSWAHVGIVSAVMLGLIFLSKNVATANFGSILVTKAVGLAAFSGHSLAPNSMFIALSILLAGITAGAFYSLTRQRLSSIQMEPVKPQSELHWWKFGILFTLVAVFIFPDVLHGVPRHAILWSGMYVPQWDSDNAVTWAYMIKNGLLPFKDFWYPYAMSFAFDLALPWGIFFQYFVLLALFGALFYFISVVSRSAYWIVVILIFIIFLSGLVNQNVIIFPQPERHLFPFVICLAYIAASGSGGRRKISIWPFWLATCIGLVIEPSQVAYAALGVGLVLLFDIFNTLPLQWLPLLKRLVRDFAVPAVFLSIAVTVLVLSGVIQNVGDMYLEMGSIANYMAVPTNLDLNFGNMAGRSFFLVAGPFVILALGIFESIASKNPNDLLPKAIMAVGAIGVLQLQKHGVRPIDWALFYSSASGIVLYSVLLSRHMGIKSMLFFGSMVGITAAIFINTLSVNQAVQRFAVTGPRVAAAVDVLTMDAKELAAYRAEQFSPARLRAFSDEIALLNELKLRVGRMPEFYSLPDAPVLYVLAGAKPPYQINGFSLSPVFEQNKIVEYLHSKNIEYVIVEPAKSFIDGFAYSVRLPVLYSYVVANYVLDFSTPRFTVFRLRKPSERTSFDAWASILDDPVQLGHLPQNSVPPESYSLSCEFNCDDILKVTITRIEQEQPVTISIVVNGKARGISFVAVPEKTEYWINLNRIWFWAAKFDSVTAVQIGKITQAGLSVQIFRLKQQRPEHLY